MAEGEEQSHEVANGEAINVGTSTPTRFVRTVKSGPRSEDSRSQEVSLLLELVLKAE